MPGPAPKPASQRRRNNSILRGSLKLPRSGRRAPSPPWPLDIKATKPQLRLWNQLWVTPQAIAWENLGWQRTVARYAVICIVSERTVSAPHLAETRQLEDRLGLSPMAMRRLGWEIEDDRDEGENSANVTAIADYRAMFEGDPP